MSALWNKLLLYGAAVVAAVLAYVGWKAKVRADAVDDERARQDREVLEAAQDRREIDQVVASANDRDLDDMLRPPPRG